MSDSHDNIEALRKAVELFNKENVELVVHCGDFVAPFVFKVLKKLNADFIGVFGNNDGEILGLLKQSDYSIFRPPYQAEFAGKKLLIMHEPLFVEQVAASGEFDILLYGHTHEIDIRKVGKTLIVNPGEVCGYISGKRSVALIDEKLNVSVREL